MSKSNILYYQGYLGNGSAAEQVVMVRNDNFSKDSFRFISCVKKKYMNSKLLAFLSSSFWIVLYIDSQLYNTLHTVYIYIYM